MAMPYKLTKELSEQYQSLREPLTDRIAELREQYDNATERWQESERGSAVSDWLDAAEEVVQAMENFEMEPSE